MLDALLLFLAAAWPVLAFAALAVGLAWWALFGDKARGRRRCPRCWHDLSGTPGMTCGECGFSARLERQFARTRRRWLLAAGAVAAMLAVATAAQLSILAASWPSYLPDAVAVRVPRLAPAVELPRALVRELFRRVALGELDAEELLTLVRSVAEPGIPAGAAEDQWARLVSAVLEADPAGTAAAADDPPAVAARKAASRAAWRSQLEAELDRWPPWIEVTAPRRWSPGAAAPGAVRGTVWGRPAEWRVRVRDGGGPWLVGAGDAGMHASPRSGPLELPAPGPDGRIRATIELEVRRLDADGSAWLPWAAQPPVVVDSACEPSDGAAPPEIADPAADARVRDAFDNPATAWTAGNRPVSVRFGLQSLGNPSGAVMAYGMAVELLEGDRVRRSMRVWCGSGDTRRAGWIVDREDAEALERLRRFALSRDASDPPTAVPGWSLRVRSDRAAARQALANEASPPPAGCWAGEVALPLLIQQAPGAAPPRSYRIEPAD